VKLSVNAKQYVALTLCRTLTIALHRCNWEIENSNATLFGKMMVDVLHSNGQVRTEGWRHRERTL